MSVLNKLTEGIVNRDLGKEGTALLTKWEKTGLLEGLDSERSRQSMASLLENQAKELLREASSMAGGDAEGFAAVAFPIVRRVFGGLIANDLVSVQPMSLPSGLIFFLDFQVANNTQSGRLGYTAEDSLYGGGVVGQQLTGGVNLSPVTADGSDDPGEDSFYNLNNGFASPTGSAAAGTCYLSTLASGTVGTGDVTLDKYCRFDPDLSGSVAVVALMTTGTTTLSQLNTRNMVGITLSGHAGRQIRRLTELQDDGDIQFVVSATGSETADQLSRYVVGAQASTPTDFGDGLGAAHVGAAGATISCEFPITDNFNGTPAAGDSAALGSVVGSTTWGLENNEEIPEIDIKVDSVSVTAITKKLKAKWTPELGQDLNAYHNLDAEVELTSVLSEHIALEVDREILEDLVKGATASTYYWSRRPGKFLNRTAGTVTNQTLHPDFTGTVSEWYETLIETINDVSAQIHRKTLRGGANFLVCGPEVANVLEFTSGFRANITSDDNKGTVGAVKAGNISKKWDVWVDPYFMRNVILVGRKGGSFLESGYVYAPYVPLQVTPTIFGVEDFVPRKGVMTRYAKKMVRPDMYGLVIVADLLG